MIVRPTLLCIALALCAAATVPPPAPPQQKIWRIGWLDPGPALISVPGTLKHFRWGMTELGYVEGKNYVVEGRFADADLGRLPGLAKDLVAARVDLIVTIGTPPLRAAMHATKTIPIVMAGGSDPVAGGLVASFAHPGGNVTGLTHDPGPAVLAEGLQLLKQAAPDVSRIAVIWDSQNRAPGWSGDDFRRIEKEVQARILVHDVKAVKSADDFNAVLAAIKRQGADAVFATPDFTPGQYAMAVVDFASANRLPSLFWETSTVRSGGLMSYYTDWHALHRRAATYVDKILRGANPADLPVERPAKLCLAINLKTAAALGLTIPDSLRARADKVID